MLMVVILHILGAGGVLNAGTILSGQYETAYFLEIAAYCAVNCYALISGYVGVSAKYKYSNIAILWLRVIFYTVLITALFAVVFPESVSKGLVIRAFFPVTCGTYWYFTAYVVLFLFIPFLNLALKNLTKKQLKILLSIIFFVICVWNTGTVTVLGDTFKINAGYSAWWLIILYLFGGYIRLYGMKNQMSKWKWLAGYGMAVFLTWLFKFGIEKFTDFSMGNMLMSYTSFTIVLAAICLLKYFSEVHIPERARSVIKFVAPLSFSVYIIHSQPLIWEYLIKNRFSEYIKLAAWKIPLTVIATAIIIFIVCILADYIREVIFRIFKIRQKLEKLETQLLKRLRQGNSEN